MPGEKGLRLLKYAILVGFVLLIPLYVVDILGQGQPGFCKYICPAGTLEAGWPLVALNPALRSALGWLFAWKSAVLVALILLALAVWRPFCRYLCPLGAVYGLLNPVVPLPHGGGGAQVHPLRRLPEGLPDGYPGGADAQQPGVCAVRCLPG